jgi:protein-S-isoprenylcysteine O-methyltransferase Ste14
MQDVAWRSPWWYRHRVWVIAAIYTSSIYLGYGLAARLHAGVAPVYASFGIGNERVMFVAGMVLAVSGWILRAWGTEYLRPAVVWNPDARADRFYVAGPFRHTRNPLYLGNLLVAAAIGLFAPPLAWPIVVLTQWVFIRALIAEEERLLRDEHAGEFDAYCEQVPRLLWRFSPALGEDAPHANLPRAMLCEPLSAAFAITFALLAAFGAGAWRYPLVVLGCGLLAQSLLRRVRSRL